MACLASTPTCAAFVILLTTVWGWRGEFQGGADDDIAPHDRRGERAHRPRKPSSPAGKFIAGVPVLDYHAAFRGAQGSDFVKNSARGSWIVGVKQDTTDDELLAMCSVLQNGCDRCGRPSSGGVPFCALSGTEGDLENFVSQADRAVRYVEPDRMIALAVDGQAATRGVDRIGADQPADGQAATWGLNRIGANQRGAALSGRGATIFVLDSGVRTTHDEFGGRASAALDCSSDGCIECNGDQTCAVDNIGHGTHCAATAAGTNVGVAPSASVKSIKLFDWDSDRDSALSFILSGIDWLATNAQAQFPAVASCSFGTRFDSDESNLSQAFVDGVEAATSQGVAVVVAAGNWGPWSDYDRDACNWVPASVPSAIAVGSTDSLDRRARSSNQGACVNIFAPGEDVKSAGRESDTEYVLGTGTSMACPHVSGAVALLLEGNPKLEPAGVLASLIDSAERDVIGLLQNDTVNLLLNVREPYTGPPTPTPPPGTWELRGTGCQMKDNCITSNSFPYKYGNMEGCIVELYGYIPIRVDAFDVRSGDFLIVGGVSYDGLLGPPNGSYTGTIRWQTSDKNGWWGWKLCRTDWPDAPTPAPTPLGTWEVFGVGCQMEGNCVSSSNYPLRYNSDETCTVALHGYIPLRVDAWDVEDYLDRLDLGGFRFNGETGPPPDCSYTGYLHWRADMTLQSTGWKICRTDEADAPTPAPPPPGTWELRGTGCQMEANCISSNFYPYPYGDREYCVVELWGEIPLRTDFFDIEDGYDFVTIGGVPYSGRSGPPTGSYTGKLVWESDGIWIEFGWKLCRTDEPDAPTPPPGPWYVQGTGCWQKENCVTSSYFGAPRGEWYPKPMPDWRCRDGPGVVCAPFSSGYLNNENCEIQLTENVQVTVEAFVTEKFFDVLTINGTAYSGSASPPNGVYTGAILWSSDSSWKESGWKLCFG